MKYKIISNIKGIQKTIQVPTKDKQIVYKIVQEHFRTLYNTNKIMVGVERTANNIFVNYYE